MKRERSNGGEEDVATAVESAVSGVASTATPPPPVAHGERASFGVYLWNDIGVVLFHRMLLEVHASCLRLVQTLDDIPRSIREMRYNMLTIWAVGKTFLSEDEAKQYDEQIEAFVLNFVACCEHSLQGVTDEVSACRNLLRTLEEQGFPEQENGDIAHYMSDVCQATELNCYSYSERTNMTMPLLPRYDGDKRCEDEHTRHRVGHLVTLPEPHPHPEVNTAIQLAEPKKRRTQLDEYRIFSHPKKATTYGVEDFMVDEELLHRSYVVLIHHIDTFGCLSGLSPFARFLLWDILGRDDAAFQDLYNKPATTEDARVRIEEVRRTIAARKKAFDDVRPSAREAAQRIGWYAVSAQWRDQVLTKLSDMEETDWYAVGDIMRVGGQALFPNYASVVAIRKMALGVVKKMDLNLTEADIPPVATVVESLLLPLLHGECPKLTSFCFQSGHMTSDSANWHSMQKRLRHAFSSKKATTAHTDVVNASAVPSVVCTYICPSMVFPLQCLAELLELCALAFHSPAGLVDFTKQMLQAEWSDEEDLLRHLLKTEPLNPAIAPMAAIPRLYKDLATGIQLLAREKMLPCIVEARRLAEESNIVSIHTKEYLYWRILSNVFLEKERYDTLVLLTVSTAQQPPPLGSRWYTEASMESVPKVWPEDLQEFMEKEREYKAQHPLNA